MKFSDFLGSNNSGSRQTEGMGTVKGLYNSILNYVELNIENARLSAAEKASIFLTTIAFTAILFIIGSFTLLFISIGVGHYLAETIAPHWAYLFVAAFYVLLLIFIIIFKDKLVLHPVTRFVTRIFLAPPRGNDDPTEGDSLKDDIGKGMEPSADETE